MDMYCTGGVVCGFKNARGLDRHFCARKTSRQNFLKSEHGS